MSFLARGEAGNPWFSWSYVQDNYDTLRDALLDHVVITVWSVAIAVVIAIPLAVLAYWVRPLATPILTSAGVLYTIPSLGSMSRLTMRSTVDLPQPDGPMSTVTSPLPISRLSSPTATVPSGYTLRSRSSAIGAASGFAVTSTHVLPGSR